MYLKRIFDISFSFIGLTLLLPLMISIAFFILILNGYPVLFEQKRIGIYGKKFKLFKFRTMIINAEKLERGTISTSNDPRITRFGGFLRKWKLDELPSLFNVLIGEMSIVGPRPDVPGYADMLKGDDRRILSVLPGITGPATLKYSNEEQILGTKKDPKKYNDKVIFPDKIRLNLDYIDNWSMSLDIKIIYKTIFRRNY